MPGCCHHRPDRFSSIASGTKQRERAGRDTALGGELLEHRDDGAARDPELGDRPARQAGLDRVRWHDPSLADLPGWGVV